MHRREFFTQTLKPCSLAVFALSATSGIRIATAKTPSESLQPLAKRDRIRVAFLLGGGANVIDTAGPWEVFQDVMLGSHTHPFELFTVGLSQNAVKMSGGLQVMPNYSVSNEPQPNVIVVPAHQGTYVSRSWLRDAAAATDVTMSVCTGAFELARAGLLKGVAATTHHDYWDAFAQEFPGIELRRGVRFVDNGRIATAGGLTSGIDMALHIVTRYFGMDTAAATARYMEYSSEAWRMEPAS